MKLESFESKKEAVRLPLKGCVTIVKSSENK